MALSQRLRVLVVDDERAIREVIRDFLGLEQYDVITAENGEEALHLIADQSFDLLLTDLEMPKMGGIALLRQLHGHTRKPLPIIMTGYATVENTVEAMREGAYDYILKPFKIDDVLHTLRKAADKLRLERENLQLRQAMSLYEISRTWDLSVPIVDGLGFLLDTLSEALATAEAVAVLVQEGAGPARIACSRATSPAGQLMLDALDWNRLASEFEQDRPVLHAGAACVAFAPSAQVRRLVAVPLRSRGVLRGALVAVGAGGHGIFHEGDRRLLTILAAQTVAAFDNRLLFEDLQEATTSTIAGLIVALEAKDEYTAGHSQRVARWADIIAHLAGLPNDVRDEVHKAALLHDIGKIGVDQFALTKPSKLTPEEFDAFKSHPSIGKKILAPLQFLGSVIAYVHYHHERYDGQGYPDGLAGDQIPLGARILCLADSFEVMSTDRAYRKRLPREIALAELQRCAGAQFDPELARLLYSHLVCFDTFEAAMDDPAIPWRQAVLTPV
jgi:response regulator RpfG family c-di-GMP phosphodiesterase